MATQELSIQRKVTVPEQASKMVKSKLEIIRLKLRVFRQFFSIIVKKTGSPIAALRLIKQIREKYQAVFGEPMLTKVAKVDGRYFWRLGAVGFPSRASVMMHENEVNRC